MLTSEPNTTESECASYLWCLEPNQMAKSRSPHSIGRRQLSQRIWNWHDAQPITRCPKKHGPFPAWVGRGDGNGKVGLSISGQMGAWRKTYTRALYFDCQNAAGTKQARANRMKTMAQVTDIYRGAVKLPLTTSTQFRAFAPVWRENRAAEPLIFND